MTTRQWLKASTTALSAAGIMTARLECLVLLEDALNTNRVQLLANPDLLITIRQQKKLEKLLARRARHEPLAYIRNQTEFYGRTFYVDQRVLEPRSESETMVELTKSLVDNQRTTIIDVGTGSGALAITIKKELPLATVIALDIDSGCLSVARKNAATHRAEIIVLKSDLLTGISDAPLDGAVLLCNLPYVPNEFRINLAATHEPKLAIYGGADGLDLYRHLFEQLARLMVRPNFVLTEALPPQHEALAAIAKNGGFVLERSEDFIQVFKTGTADLGL